MKITVDTITDVQLRELQAIAYHEVRYGLIELSTGALAGNKSYRARCAEILDARMRDT